MSDIEVIDLTGGEYDYDFSKWSKEIPPNSIRYFDFDGGLYYYYFKDKSSWKIEGVSLCYDNRGYLVIKSYYKHNKLHGEVVKFYHGNIVSIEIYKHGFSEGETYEGVEACKKYFVKKRLKNL
jgi:antitoxin component YwqK of YwqJK toxin-antitoxin module